MTEGGKVYGRTSTVLEYVPEDYFRAARAHFPGPEGWLDQLVSLTNRNEAGLLADTAQLYGMEAFTLDQLTVLEGTCPPSMSRGATPSPQCTPTMTTATPGWTPTGPV